MSYANPAVYGAPNTWQYCKYTYVIGNGNAAIKAEKPKIPNWGDNLGTLAKGNSTGKTPINEGIDSSICPCKQSSSVSCFGNIALFKNYQDSAKNIVPDKVITRSEPCNWFMYDGSGVGLSSGTNRIRNRDNAQERWSPEADLTSNWNGYINPFVYWQLKSILAIVYVNTITGYDSRGIPIFTRRTLNDWKNNYSNLKITDVIMDFRCYSSYTGNQIYYTGNSGDDRGLIGMIAPLDDIDGIIDYAAFAKAINKQFTLVGSFFSGNYYNTSSTLYITGYDMFDNAEYKSVSYVNTDGGWNLWAEIPYSADNYEKIMKMVACFGIPFTDTDRTAFPVDYLDNDLYLPVIGSNGVTQGEYTSGSNNANNRIYHLDSIWMIHPDMYPMERPEQINVYPISEPQNGFNNNGLAILMPIECISDKEERGRWDLTLTHPIDDYGKWTYIVGQNVLKVNGQLFRIDETEIYQDADTAYISAHAQHITYDLFGRFVDELTVENGTGDYYIYKVIERSQEILPTHQPEPNEYTFDISSDIEGPVTTKVQDQTVIGALFGDDNSLASRYGGQLYRDNFHMSINTTQEGAPTAPAFKLRFGTDLTKLSYKIDFSNWITELICVSNMGDLWAVSYTGSEWIIHHQRTRRMHFTYDPDTPDPFECLMRDGFAYWQTVNTPTVSIEVSVAALKNDPKYKDFVDLQNLDVGYTGNVYIEQYGIDINLKIVSIRRDELTGEALQVVLGTSRGSFIRSPVMSQTIVANGTVLGKQEAEMQAMKEQIDDMKIKQMRHWSGTKAYSWSEVKNYTWREIFVGHKN